MPDSEIDSLKIKIFQLEVNLSIQQVKIVALTRLLELKQEQEKKNSELFLAALAELERSYAHEILRTYSDGSPGLATIAKQYFDRAFPPENLGSEEG